MYESPIDIIYNDIQYKVAEEFEKNVISAVQSYGIDVNREELLKALQYDRQQYEKGYADAKAEQRWIPCSERLPEDDTLMLVTYIDHRPDAGDVWIGWHEMENVWYIDGEEHSKERGNEVLAWMPLPEQYREGKA